MPLIKSFNESREKFLELKKSDAKIRPHQLAVHDFYSALATVIEKLELVQELGGGDEENTAAYLKDARREAITASFFSQRLLRILLQDMQNPETQTCQ